MESFREKMERMLEVYPTECPGRITEGEVYTIFDYVRHPEKYEATAEDVTRMMYFDSHVDSCEQCTKVFQSRLDAEEAVAFFLKKREPQSN